MGRWTICAARPDLLRRALRQTLRKQDAFADDGLGGRLWSGNASCFFVTRNNKKVYPVKVSLQETFLLCRKCDTIVYR